MPNRVRADSCRLGQFTASKRTVGSLHHDEYQPLNRFQSQDPCALLLPSPAVTKATVNEGIEVGTVNLNLVSDANRAEFLRPTKLPDSPDGAGTIDSSLWNCEKPGHDR
jgi:hypothetical protein